ncbi:acyltransferase family protein [Planctomyces sp. SH-PL62]|uniref:acyltransferase family protein n=1 Tax=Planctomyces sp. SH-PL62 TaxID=1636152 RepID=UPI0012E891F3|nr:acyltransferase [Planctomyces sp. SH-PL62]
MRIHDLDGLRGIAAIAVVFYHYTTCYRDFFSYNAPLPFSFQYGMYGVQLFFLISGFVVLMSVERKRDPLDFAKSRFIRLYPAYWASLLFVVLLIALTPGPREFIGWGRLFRRAAADVSMVQGWFHIASLSGTYWTLGLEMTFYVVVLLLLFYKKLDWIVPMLCGLVVIGAIDGLCCRYRPNPVSPWLRSALALDYIHYMLVGVLIYKMRETPRPAYVVVAVLSLFATYTQDPARHEAGKELVVGAVLALIVMLATNGRLGVLRWKVPVFLGAISYSLYLNHSVLGFHIIYNAQRYGLSPIVSIALAIAASIILATATTFYFEKPVMATLRRRFHSPPPSSTAPTPCGAPSLLPSVG